MATHVPPAPGPSHHDAPNSGDFPSARVEEDDWEPIRTWSRRVSSPGRLRDELELIHTKITQHREIIDFIRARGMSPANHYYRDLDLLHAEYDQLSQTLVESREAFASRRRRGSPDVTPPGVASPAAAPRPDSSSRTGFACHLSLALPHLGINDSLLKTVLVHETSQAIVPVNVEFQKIAHASDSSLAISLATDGDSLQGIPPLQSAAGSLRMIPLHLSIGTHPVPLLVMVHFRDLHQGLLLPVHLRLLGKIGTQMILPSLPQFGR